MSQSKNLLEIWDVYANRVILAEKAPAKKTDTFSSKPGKGPAALNSKEAQAMAHKDTSGPNSAKPLQKPLDVKDVKTNPKDAVYGVQRFTVANGKFDESIEKRSKAVINNYMKSIFDKLFEDVMGGDDSADLKALGVDTKDGLDAGQPGEEGMGDESGDVTVTLTADQVDCLRAILSQLDGDDASGDDLEQGLGDEGSPETDEIGNPGEEDSEEEDKEDEDVTKESVAASVDNNVDGSGKVLGTAITDEDKLNNGFVKKGNAVVKSTVSKLGKKGSLGNGNVANAVDGSGKVLGTAITDEDKLSSGMTKVGKGANVVKTKIGKPGSDFFS
jgi:hypothetical protein